MDTGDVGVVPPRFSEHLQGTGTEQLRRREPETHEGLARHPLDYSRPQPAGPFAGVETRREIDSELSSENHILRCEVVIEPHATYGNGGSTRLQCGRFFL